VFEDGTSWTYAELRDLVVRKAAGLTRLGVKRGDHVAVWLPNGREALVTFYAINYLGGVFVPFNTAYRGSILEHVLANSDATVLVAHGGLLDRLEGADTAAVTTIVQLGEGTAPARFTVHAFDAVTGEEAELAPLDRPIEPWDTQSIIYTSGTTGPSKGVLSSYLHLYTNAGPESWHFVTGKRPLLVDMPVFHLGGLGIPFVMLARGGSIALMENFSTDTFWDFSEAHRLHGGVPPGRDGNLPDQAPAGAGRPRSWGDEGLHGATHRSGGRVPRTLRDRRLHHLRHDRDFLAHRLGSPIR
jgi:crotonobetaine/carnitine-CoA ligase